MIFQERLNYLIKNNNISQKDLAKKISEMSNNNVSPQTMSNFTSGREPNYQILVSIADYFKVSLDYLLGRDNRDESTLRSEKEILKEEIGGLQEKIKRINEILYGTK